MAPPQSKNQPRSRVSCGRVSGKVLSWGGDDGWITPDAKVNHPLSAKFNGGIYIKRTDVGGGQPLTPGTVVDFLVYAQPDDRLGAEFVRVKPAGASPPAAAASEPKPPLAGKGKGKGSVAASPKTVIPTIVKNKVAPAPVQGHKLLQPMPKSAPKAAAGAPAKGAGKASSAASSAASKGQTAASPAKGAGKAGAAIPAKGAGKAGAASPAKGAGKAGAASPGKGPAAPDTQKQPRTRVTPGVRHSGRVKKWMGKFGWIAAEAPIDDPAANKHKGDIYLAVDDLPSGQTVEVGTMLDFLLYSDSSGLGAESLRILPAGTTTQGAAKGSAAGVSKGSSGAVSSTVSTGKGAQKGSVGKVMQKGSVGQVMQKGSVGKGVQKTILKVDKVMVPTAKGMAAKGMAAKNKPGGAQLQKGAGKAQAQKGASKGAAAAPAPQETPLPPGWEEHYSDEYEVPYFWHTRTKQSVWIRPTK